MYHKLRYIKLGRSSNEDGLVKVTSFGALSLFLGGIKCLVGLIMYGGNEGGSYFTILIKNVYGRKFYFHFISVWGRRKLFSPRCSLSKIILEFCWKFWILKVCSCSSWIWNSKVVPKSSSVSDQSVLVQITQRSNPTVYKVYTGVDSKTFLVIALSYDKTFVHFHRCVMW